MENDRYVLICPPVSSLSSSSEIRAWISELEAMDPSPEAASAREEALSWLEVAQERESG